MIRVHRITHPTLGPASWKQINAARAQILKELGRRVCSWCQGDVPSGYRTRCGKAECNEKLWQVQRWERCRWVKLRSLGSIKACERCRATRVELEVDHIVPVSLGGTGDQNNLRALCVVCHKAATARLRREKSEYKAA